jgi:hypothetical protein
MAYTVDFSDSTKTAITVNDGTVNTTDTSLALVGKNFYGYGEYIAENQLHLLENFADSTSPSNGVEGQIWYDSGSGDFKYYNGTSWVGFSSGGMQSTTIVDSTSTSHDALVMKVGSTIIGVISTDAAYSVNTTSTVGSTADVYAAWTTNQIKPGFNMNPDTSSQTYKFVGIATSAEYADLAEMYSSDADYEPGTIVKIGGEAEVTQTTEAFDPEVFGIVSTNPAYLMNSGTDGVAVALEGRVPCKVIGPVTKGQRLVSSEEPGVARAVSDYERQEALDWYRIVGRALADKTTEGVGLVEVVVGRK